LLIRGRSSRKKEVMMVGAQMANTLVVKKTHTLLVMISVFMRNINTMMTMAKAENTLAILRMLEVYLTGLKNINSYKLQFI